MAGDYWPQIGPFPWWSVTPPPVYQPSWYPPLNPYLPQPYTQVVVTWPDPSVAKLEARVAVLQAKVSRLKRIQRLRRRKHARL